MDKILKYGFALVFIMTSLSCYSQQNKIEVKIKKDYIVKVYVNHRLVKEYPKNLIDNRKMTIHKRNGYRLEIKPIKKTKVFQIHYLNEFEVFKEDLNTEFRENT